MFYRYEFFVQVVFLSVICILQSSCLTGCALSKDKLLEFIVGSSQDVPTEDECADAKLGFYTWDQSLWQNPNNNILQEFLSTDQVKSVACGGDVWLSVGDYSSADKIHRVENLLPFIKDLRKVSGASFANRGVIYLVYADIGGIDPVAAVKFVDTVYNQFLSTLSLDDIREIGPIGVSLDMERVDPENVKDVLTKLDHYKDNYMTHWPAGHFYTQQVVEGRPNQEGTRVALEHADSTLWMVYRSYMDDNLSGMNLPVGGNLLHRFKFMLGLQCPQCFNDDYNPRGKITILVEADCDLWSYCGRLSFCAQDAGGSEFLLNALRDMRNQIVPFVMSQSRFDKLMDTRSQYGVHNFHWSRCQFDTVRPAHSHCGSEYRDKAQKCRERQNQP